MRIIISESQFKKLILEQVDKQLEKTINFDSGYWSASGGKINEIMSPELESMKQFIIDNKSSIIQIRLSAGESKVPNRDAEASGKPRLEPKELSKRRYNTIKEYLTKWLQSLQKEGIIQTIPKFVESEPIIGGPEWNPTGGDKASDEKFKNHQYLKVFIEVTSEPEPVKEPPMNSNTGRTYGQYKTTKMKTTYAYGYNFKWLKNSQWVDVDKNSVPSRMLTNAGTIVLKTDMSSVGGPKPFKWDFIGDSNCSKIDPRRNYDPPQSNSGKDVQYCNTYKALVDGTNEPTKEQWQYIYMYVKKEENHYKHKDWSFISNKPSELKPNLRLNGTPNTGGYEENTLKYYK